MLSAGCGGWADAWVGGVRRDGLWCGQISGLSEGAAIGTVSLLDARGVENQRR